MEIEGIIIAELPIREGISKNGYPYKIASYVIETMEQYPHRMAFQVSDGIDGRIARLGIAKGKRMRVYFYINARESDGKWYNTITVSDAREVVLQPATVTPTVVPMQLTPTAQAAKKPNDLPF